MKISQYIVRTFIEDGAKGSNAAVYPLEKPLPAETMEKIAAENGALATAFIDSASTDEKKAHYNLSCYLPGGEIDVCGQAALAAAYVVSRHLKQNVNPIELETPKGKITVMAPGEWVIMNMPGFRLKSVPVTDEMETAFGVRPTEAYLDRDLICVFDSEETIRSIQPNFELVASLEGEVQAITAASAEDSEADVVSRCFAPKYKVNEDAVSASTSCAIASLWASKLDMAALVNEQLSAEGNTSIRYGVNGARVLFSGMAEVQETSEIEA